MKKAGAVIVAVDIAAGKDLGAMEVVSAGRERSGHYHRCHLRRGEMKRDL